MEHQLEKSLDYVLQEIKLDDLKSLLVFRYVSGKLVMTSVTSVVNRIRTIMSTPVNHHLGINKHFAFDHTNESPDCTGGIVLLKRLLFLDVIHNKL